ncbi:MAG TPA: hypothetical protein VGP70_23195 [Actinomadura sp.]|jgi:hypothetical protein|nr:hypothetical protein [Actinomadura sp.]
MGIPKSMALAVSGLLFAGGAAMAVGAAAPANAQTVLAPQQLVADGCCGGRNSTRWRQYHHNSWRDHQRVIVINRNHNFSRSANEQFQRQRGQQELEQRHQPMTPPA